MVDGLVRAFELTARVVRWHILPAVEVDAYAFNESAEHLFDAAEPGDRLFVRAERIYARVPLSIAMKTTAAMAMAIRICSGTTAIHSASKTGRRAAAEARNQPGPAEPTKLRLSVVEK